MHKVKYLIVGNGFDRAHKMKTSYFQFLEFLFNDQKKNKPEIITNPLFTDDLFNKSFEEVIEHLQNDIGLIQEHFQNIFYKMALLKRDTNGYWADLEQLYLELLIDENSSYSPKKLNTEFKIIIEYLEKYLVIENSKNDNKINALSEYLSLNKFAKIINLNYTTTLELYRPKDDIIYLHGKLNDIENPIIFGNGPDDSVYDTLLDLRNDEYLSYIKNHLYKTNPKVDKILKDLDECNGLEGIECSVELFGVSCGSSDHHFLLHFLQREVIKEIIIWHHNGVKSYSETKLNLERILRSKTDRNKILPYDSKYNIPQAENKNTDVI